MQGFSYINSLGLHFCPCNNGTCCAGLKGLRSYVKGELGPARYLVSVIAAVTVRVSLLPPSAHSFIHSEGLGAQGWTRPSQLSQDQFRPVPSGLTSQDSLPLSLHFLLLPIPEDP